MQIGSYKFDRNEFAGSLGDLGTLVPLSVALMMMAGVHTTATLLLVGLYYLASGVFFRLPLPVQPLKVVAAVAVAFPEKMSLSLLAAAGIEFGVILLVLSWTGLLDRLGRWFTKPIVRGIQLGLGLILMAKGIDLVLKPGLFLNSTQPFVWSVTAIPINIVIGILAFGMTLTLLSSRKLPGAILLVGGGIVIGLLCGAFKNMNFEFGPQAFSLVLPQSSDWWPALTLLVLPQIPLTIGNAVIGTADACQTYFKDDPAHRRTTYRSLATSMGLANIVAGCCGAMLMCHGAGGLAAHYRFGARTGGSNLMIGAIFVGLALLFGEMGLDLLTAIPSSVLGVLLIFAGIELASLILDIKNKNTLFVTLLIAGVALATTHMGIAFVVGIGVSWIIRLRDIEL